MDAEQIAFRDAEDTVRVFLTEQLPEGTGVYAGSLPTNLPGASVRILRTGGISFDLVVDEAQLTVEARAAAGEPAALNLASRVRTLLNAAEREGRMADAVCYQVREISGIYLDPDPVNPSQARYSATYTVALRAA